MDTMTMSPDQAANDRRVRVSGVPITQCCEAEILQVMDNSIYGDRQPQYVVITNTESMYYAKRAAEHAEFIEHAAFSCCDGIGVTLAGMFQGVWVARIYGSAFVRRACEFGVRRSWKHFFYGGRPGVPEMMSRNLQARFPGMNTVGTYSPPFRPLTPEEDDQAVRMINDSDCDIVWVGLGLPKQERWIAAHRERIRAPWMIGVGAAFDYYAGTVKRAPVWLQQAGFEWLYRVIHEPRMLIRNYRSLVFLGESLYRR
jgi:N-acetylglucosaminyldiphosphoundecaprenol N-acetyl-beta-D-mannosaminyltransferase